MDTIAHGSSEWTVRSDGAAVREEGEPKRTGLSGGDASALLDEEEERDIHLRAAMEHLQGAGFSARTARQVIGEIIRREREDDGHHDDRHDAERRRHAEEHERDHHDRDEHDRDHRDRCVPGDLRVLIAGLTLLLRTLLLCAMMVVLAADDEHVVRGAAGET